MKIIRVSSCADCPYPTEEDGSDYLIFYCTHDNAPKGLIVKGYIDKKTIPGNCPLEDESIRTVSDGDSFEFLHDKEEDIYSNKDGETIS